jgi:choline dehydrogenase
METHRSRSDYVVVGAGAAGCVVAARLADNPDNEVVLIEAGGSDLSPFLRLPGLGFAAGAIGRYNWNFVTEPIAELADRRLTLLAGKVLGGSSSINGMIYTRGHSSEYDRWRELGCTGWGFEDVRPYFLKSESNVRGAGEWHGDAGPMRLRRADPRLPICDAFLAAAAAAGLPVVDDLNANHAEGLGWYDVNIDRGLRMSSARAFLPPARRRPNLSVVTGVQVTRIVLSGGRATGVEGVRGSERVAFGAQREVIVCAGAIKSPQLLMVSGIGPADELRRHGIDVVVDSPQVGSNLQNHPCYRPRFACSSPVTARNHVGAMPMLRAGLAYARSRSGPLAESFASAGGFFRSDPGLALADMQVVMLSALPPRGGQRIRDLLPKEQGFALTVYQGSPYSRGRVALRSSSPLDAPLVHTGYFSDPRDLDVLAAGVQRMRDVMRQPAIARYISAAVVPRDTVRSRAELIDDIRREAATSYHQCGTCAMGPDDAAVLDVRLRVRGVAGLRVADASVAPRLPNAALHAVTLMIGEKAAAMILEDAGRG